MLSLLLKTNVTLGQMELFPPAPDLPLRRRVSVEIIPTKEARHVLEKYHYLHRARVGRQINYAVLVNGRVDGVITYAYPMMSKPLLGIPSDELIEFARLFLYSNIPHTATCAIGKTLRRVKKDWMTRFPTSKEPRLVVSWSDTTFHKGTIYKAANFKWVRRTNVHPWGRQEKEKGNSKRGNRVRHSDYGHDKDCWVFSLETGGNGY